MQVGDYCGFDSTWGIFHRVLRSYSYPERGLCSYCVMSVLCQCYVLLCYVNVMSYWVMSVLCLTRDICNVMSEVLCVQVTKLKSKTLKPNFAQDEAFLISRAKLLFVWLILQRISQKRISRTSATSNKFSSSHTRISRSQASLFYFWMPPAGHLQALQQKPSRQAAFICYCFGQCL